MDFQPQLQLTKQLQDAPDCVGFKSKIKGGASIAQRQSVRLPAGRLGVRSTTTEWIAVALLGQERSPQPPGKKHYPGFGLSPITVTKIKLKNKVKLRRFSSNSLRTTTHVADSCAGATRKECSARKRWMILSVGAPAWNTNIPPWKYSRIICLHEGNVIHKFLTYSFFLVFLVSRF